MSNRIFLGIQDNKAVMRVGLPGVDASKRTGPLVFSSENDYLKVHRRGPPQGSTMKNIGNGAGAGRYIYTLYESFPDLGYIPTPFFTVCVASEGGLNNRVIFPFDYSGATDRYPVSVQCAIARTGIWWECTGYNFSQTLKIKFIIFKNPLRG